MSGTIPICEFHCISSNIPGCAVSVLGTRAISAPRSLPAEPHLDMEQVFSYQTSLVSHCSFELPVSTFVNIIYMILIYYIHT